MDIGIKIARCRKKMGFSQEDLAERLDISRQAVSRWEVGEVIPDAEKIVLLSKIFGVTIDYLLLDEQQEPQKANDIQKNADTAPPTVPDPVVERRRKFRIGAGIATLVLGILTVILALVLAVVWAVFTTEWRTEWGRFGTGLFFTWRFILLLAGLGDSLIGVGILIVEYRRKK